MFEELHLEDEEMMALKEGPQHLLVRLQERLFAIDASYVSEIVELVSISKIPWMHPSVLGVCNIRRGVVGVIDLSQRLYEKPFTPSQKSAIVIVNIPFEEQMHRVGLVVDEVLEIEVFEEDMLQKPPSFGLSVASEFVAAVAHYNQEYLLVLMLLNVVAFEELSTLREGSWMI